MQLNPYLLFNGQCEAAFKFYQRCLGGKIEMMLTHEGTPMAKHVPPEWLKKILHSRLVVGDTVLMASDAPPDRYAAMKGFSVSACPPCRFPPTRERRVRPFGLACSWINWMINCESAG